MNRNHIFSVLAIALVTVMALGIAAPAVHAQEGDNQRRITVTGVGNVSGAPDIAVLSLGVETNNPDILPALQNNNSGVDAVIAALEAQGVEGQDIRTEYFNIYQDRPYVDPMIPSENQPQPTYRVTHVLNITLRNTDMLGDVLNAAIEAGANVVNNVYFDINNRTELEGQARTAALADARVRAEQIANELGVELGDVVVVVEESQYGSVPYANSYGVGGGSGGSFAPGTLSVSISVRVTFAVMQ